MVEEGSGREIAAECNLGAMWRAGEMRLGTAAGEKMISNKESSREVVDCVGSRWMRVWNEEAEGPLGIARQYNWNAASQRWRVGSFFWW